ncbi:rhodanese-like domain-containing protein [Catellicoccus marimammalium]|uniref:Rhodanese-like domain-contianing protein n=1 Tax=Catellicoccus marimammalium M35/04/3 TaxID=1234409 RepID=K8ZML5_9ENTE|nr:rhodanese-like domain-containing protein [Catellicoccus marimammalium]EKU26861.1 Rhodanese-like domain-contianing protein [Catellicoccus marimammalium M35/04/3]
MSVIAVVNLILIIILVGLLANMLYVYVSLKRKATQLEEAEFRVQSKNQQLIDTRERDSFNAGHIMGARNFPYSMLKEVGQSLRKDRPIYLYAQTKGMEARSVNVLYKQGFRNIYVLKGGFDQWTGRVKKTQ